MPHFGVTEFETRRRSTVGSFVANLRELLFAMAADSRTIITVVEFSDGRYWQCWADEDSTVVIEVISNLNVKGDVMPLTPESEQQLRDLGFAEPSEGSNPNWRIEGTGIVALPYLASVTYRAVSDVLRKRPQDIVDVRTWEFKRPSNCSRDEVREASRIFRHRQGNDERQGDVQGKIT